LISQRVDVLDETVAKLGQQSSHSLMHQDTRSLRLEQQTQRKEAEHDETLTRLKAMLEVVTGDLLKARQDAIQTQNDQCKLIQSLDERSQRAETAMQQAFNSLW
jgi:hypothetical protein